MIKWWWIAWVAAMQVQRWLQATLTCHKKTAMQSHNTYANDEEKIVDIINLLIKILMLKKEISKNYSWKEIALKLMHHLQLNSEEKHYMI